MSLLAIIHCTLLPSAKGVGQDLVLLEGGFVRAVGRSELITLPVRSRLLDARRGMVTGVRGFFHDIPSEITLPASLQRGFREDENLSYRVLLPGMPADLVCYDRFGRLGWCLHAGQVRQGTVCHQSEERAAPVSAPHFHVAHLLQTHPAHIELQYVRKESAYRRQGIDFVWRFCDQAGGKRIIRVQVVAARERKRQGFVWLPQMQRSQADWCFYMFDPHRGYAIPLRSTRRWLRTTSAALASPPPAPPFFVPFAQIHQAIPRLRELSFAGPVPETD